MCRFAEDGLFVDLADILSANKNLCFHIYKTAIKTSR